MFPFQNCSLTLSSPVLNRRQSARMSVSLGGVTSLLVYRQLLRRAASSKPEVDVVTVTADLNTRSSDGSRLNSLTRYHRKFTKCSARYTFQK
jgi:hypothetical protein